MKKQDIVKLYDWCLEQAVGRYRGKLSGAQIEMLDSIGFPWGQYEQELGKLGLFCEKNKPKSQKVVGLKNNKEETNFRRYCGNCGKQISGIQADLFKSSFEAGWMYLIYCDHCGCLYQQSSKLTGEQYIEKPTVNTEGARSTTTRKNKNGND